MKTLNKNELKFDWSKVNDMEYCTNYQAQVEAIREACREEVEAKYGRFYRRYLTTFNKVNYKFLTECIRRTCKDYGFEDACMDPKTFDICVW